MNIALLPFAPRSLLVLLIEVEVGQQQSFRVPLESLLYAPALDPVCMASCSDVVEIDAGLLHVHLDLLAFIASVLDLGLFAADGQVLRLAREGNLAHHAIGVRVDPLVDDVRKTADGHSRVVRACR